ncbi:hypothetical protein AAFF_G00178060 [Aldrovandia affinis]|uniref:Uncharacterized protein n=1 Tax=Aldrovandia affinis TaxID=143900 RepID=A0AAD7RKZ9_9TELE|nr:hypothetical protein AAFF_G00178060 [Aldrovandia affinis]
MLFLEKSQMETISRRRGAVNMERTGTKQRNMEWKKKRGRESDCSLRTHSPANQHHPNLLRTINRFKAVSFPQNRGATAEEMGTMGSGVYPRGNGM